MELLGKNRTLEVTLTVPESGICDPDTVAREMFTSPRDMSVDALLNQVRERTSHAYSAYLLAYDDRREAQRKKMLHDGVADHFATDLHDLDEIVVQRSGRSADSMRGNMLERLAAEISLDTYGAERCPEIILTDELRHVDVSTLVSPKLYSEGRPQPTIFTTYSRDEIVGEAAKLADRLARNTELQIGSDAFQTMLNASRIRVRKAEREPEPWTIVVDLYVRDHNIGFGEIKCGGNLDSSKALSEITKLLYAALATDDDLPMRMFVLYHNAPGKQSIAGALPKFFAGDRLLVDQEFWARVLPTGVTYADWQKLRQQEGRRAQDQVRALSHGGQIA